jgi:hypothetical protein
MGMLPEGRCVSVYAGLAAPNIGHVGALEINGRPSYLKVNRSV